MADTILNNLSQQLVSLHIEDTFEFVKQQSKIRLEQRSWKFLHLIAALSIGDINTTKINRNETTKQWYPANVEHLCLCSIRQTCYGDEKHIQVSLSQLVDSKLFPNLKQLSIVNECYDYVTTDTTHLSIDYASNIRSLIKNGLTSFTLTWKHFPSKYIFSINSSQSGSVVDSLLNSIRLMLDFKCTKRKSMSTDFVMKVSFALGGMKEIAKKYQKSM